MGRIKLASGKPYSPSFAERDRQALLAAYNDKGYLQAQVAVRVGQPDAKNSYPVEYEVREGTQSIVDHILVLGNDKTRKSVISKKIKLKENEPLSLSKLLQTQQSLYALGVFDQVRVAPQNPDSSAPYQDVVVRLQEAQALHHPLWIRLSGNRKAAGHSGVFARELPRLGAQRGYPTPGEQHRTGGNLQSAKAPISVHSRGFILHLLCLARERGQL